MEKYQCCFEEEEVIILGDGMVAVLGNDSIELAGIKLPYNLPHPHTHTK